jgi:transposase
VFVITREEWVDIVSLHRQGLSIRAISARLGVSRNTVRAALRREGPPSRQARVLPSKLDPYKDYLLARLAEFPELSAVALAEEIRALGYEGGLSILKEFTFPYRQRRREPVVRFETPPGRQAQADWSGLGRHLLGDAQRTPQLFVMVLGFSRALYAEAVWHADLESFLACHARAFAYFGGVPAEVLYSNAKAVAARVHSLPGSLTSSRARLCLPESRGQARRQQLIVGEHHSIRPRWLPPRSRGLAERARGSGHRRRCNSHPQSLGRPSSVSAHQW